MTKPGKCLIRGTLVLVGSLFCGPVVASESNSADGRPPVRSLLEIRREGVTIQSWDLSCGAAALAILLRYEFGEPVTEKEIARGLMRRSEYVAHPELLEIREGFSLLDLKRYVNGYGVQAAVSNSPGQKGRAARRPTGFRRRPHPRLSIERGARLRRAPPPQAFIGARVWANWT